MDLYERRVLRLREHVKSHSSKSNITTDTDIGNTITPANNENATKDSLGLDDYTKVEIMNILDKSGIEYNARSKKEELFELIP